VLLAQRRGGEGERDRRPGSPARYRSPRPGLGRPRGSPTLQIARDARHAETPILRRVRRGESTSLAYETAHAAAVTGANSRLVGCYHSVAYSGRGSGTGQPERRTMNTVPSGPVPARTVMSPELAAPARKTSDAAPTSSQIVPSVELHKPAGKTAGCSPRTVS
jgi:hypothetical protein